MNYSTLPRFGCIYVATNMVTGEQYVGQTITLLYGGRARWAGHVKKVRVAKERGVGMKAAWGNPVTRAKIMTGHRLACNTPEYKAKLSAALTGRKMAQGAVLSAAKAKWKSLYCKELQCSFQSQKHAAEYFGVCTSAVSQAIANKGRVQHKYTLTRVA